MNTAAKPATENLPIAAPEVNVPLRLILPLLLVSGACALTYQVAWMREFRLIFGGTTAANAAVLAIFMGGLGVGNLALGQRADRTRYPLRLYALLELVIVASAAVSPWAMRAMQFIYVSLGGQASLGMVGATVVRILLAALVLAVPTIAMGGTLPAAARFATTLNDDRRRALGWLYGINTIGAVLGALASAFFLLEQLGTTTTIWAAALANLLIASIAAYCGWHLAVDITPATTPSAAAVKKTKDAPRPSNHTLFIYCAAGVVGFAFFILEIVWYRMLGPLLGGSTYTFGVILAIALTGIGSGAALYPLVFRRLRPTLPAFAATCLLEAVCIGFPYALGDHVALWAGALREHYAHSLAELIAGWLLIAGIVILPAALVSGLQFPLLIALLGEGRRDVGKQVGRAFAANTLGAIAGSLVGGFWMLPAFSAPGSWVAMTLLLVGLGAIAVVISWRQRPSWRAVAACCTLAALAILATRAPGPTAYWRHGSIGAGRGPKSSADFAEQVALYNRALLWEAEGREASVGLMNSGDGLAFFVNGKSDGHAIADAGTQIMLGMLGPLLHPQPKTALVIGLGTGESGGWLAGVDSIERVDLVEIEPSIREVAERCAAVNRNALNNPKLHLILNDAREQMLTSPATYDLIISEPSNPYRAGVANLFTAEFYRSASRRLNRGGLFIQWLQAYEVDALAIAMVLETLRAEFPHVEIWTGQKRDLLLVCSHDAAPLDVATLRERLQNKYIASAVRSAWEDASLESVVAHHLAGGKTVDAIRAEHRAAAVTDDRNRLEYSLARSVGKDLEEPLYRIRELAALNDNWLPVASSEIDLELVQDQWFYWHGRDAQTHTGERKLRLNALAAATPASVVEIWGKQSRPPRLWREMCAVAHAYAVEGDVQALPLIEQLRPIDPIAADIIQAELMFVRRDLNGAAEHLERAFRQLRVSPWTSAAIVEDGLAIARLMSDNDPVAAQRFARLLDEPFAAGFMDENRNQAVTAIARSRARMSR